MAHVILGFQGQGTFFQAVPHQAADRTVEHGEHRHAQNHTGKPKQSSKEQNGKQHPEGSQSGGITQDFGTQNVAVKLLQNEDENDKNYILKIMKKYKNVYFINKRNKKYEQAKWYTKFYSSLHSNQWCLFIDIDEFLTFVNGYNLHKYVQEAEQNKCEQIKLNWMVYGNNGHLKKENGSVLARFPLTVKYPYEIHCRYINNKNTKGFVRGGKKGLFISMHYFHSDNIKGCDGNLLNCSNNTPYHFPFAWNKSYLRHYATKSEEEWRIKFVKRWKKVARKRWDTYNSVNVLPPNVPCTINKISGTC